MNDMTEEQQVVMDIDANLHRLVRNLEVLAFINPQNIAQERKKFFKSKYTENPQFKYRKVHFNPYKLHRLFFSQRLHRIKDPVIQQLFKKIIYNYSGLVQCIETINDPSDTFYYNSLRFFGTPTEKMVENARFILHMPDEDYSSTKYESSYTTEDAVEFFEDYKKHYSFDFKIVKSTAMAASAMVSNKDRSLILKKNHTYSEHQLNVLAHHEIGVHLVTTFNAQEQPLNIFSNGFPNNVETQEGLAVMAEYLSGNLTLERLKELAYRVLAVDSLAKGYDFKDTFDLIHNHYKLDRDAAFTITLRVHRAGGFTKDALYLSGLKKVYDLYQSGTSLDDLLLGKCSQDFQEEVSRLRESGLVADVKHRPASFKQNLNENKTVDFVLENLR
jgi:uncharacterized protein (TIGR02421 family)